MDNLAAVLVQLSVMIDVGETLQWACYKLEGDGPLALYAHQIWLFVLASLQYVSIIF